VPGQAGSVPLSLWSDIQSSAPQEYAFNDSSDSSDAFDMDRNRKSGTSSIAGQIGMLVIAFLRPIHLRSYSYGLVLSCLASGRFFETPI
jgi:hypothetical protein